MLHHRFHTSYQTGKKKSLASGFFFLFFFNLALLSYLALIPALILTVLQCFSVPPHASPNHWIQVNYIVCQADVFATHK